MCDESCTHGVKWGENPEIVSGDYLSLLRAKPMTENYKTKEGQTITRQNGSVEWTAIKRTHDGRYQAVADEGQNGFDATKASTFLETVYEPAFTGAGA